MQDKVNMAPVPTISITNPDMESEYLPMNSPQSTSPPGSPTVFDVVKNIENLEIVDPPEDYTQYDNATTDGDGHVMDNEGESNNKRHVESVTGADPVINGTSGHSTQAERSSTPPIPNFPEFYEQKCILLTGATGFIGRAVLWKLLSSLNQHIGKIFLLLRCGGPPHRRQLSLAERVQDEILNDKAFVNLRRSLGASAFDRIIKTKIHPMAADLSEAGIGLSDEDRKTLVKETNIILHCAGSVDGNERLDYAVKVNALGTLDLFEIANECMAMAAFVHLSPLQVQFPATDGNYEDYLLPLAGESVDSVVKNILGTDLEDLSTLFANFKPQYPNTYLLSKSIAEHLIVREIEKKQHTGGQQFPVGILRLCPVGPSVNEPLVGWAHGVNSANGAILLTGRGLRGVQVGSGDVLADVVPVDLVARTILGCVTALQNPPKDFELPTIRTITPTAAGNAAGDARIPKETPNTSPSSVRDSGASSGEVSTVRSSEASHTSTNTSVRVESLGPRANVFPYMYHITMTNTQCLPWSLAYEAMVKYWSHATNITLPPAQVYFSSSFNGSTGLSRARTVMNSLRFAASTYMNNSNSSTTNDVSPKNARKRSSQRMSKHVDKASKLSWTMRTSLPQTNTAIVDINAVALRSLLRDTEFDTYSVVPEKPDTDFWLCYFMNASYGMHYFVGMESDLRLPMPPSRWSCALQNFPSASDSNDSAHLVNKPVQSAVYSADEIAKRTKRMISQVKEILTSDSVQRSGAKDEEWLADLDDSLDDWCQDTSVISSNREKRVLLGKWRKKVGSNDDSVKIVVLNDKRVNQAVHQITQNAGVPKQTAMNEAVKILMRMSERTQVAFVWFAAYFLRSLFDDMFDSIRIHKDSIRQIKDVTLGKRVVYVPVSKSVIDPLLVWYITIRYNLPVPAFACDEALTQLGPISDIYRLSGAYYVKRDKAMRSPLNTAVTAAYTQVLLREHGALLFYLEKLRSRTGKYQEHYDDGLIDMVVESTLQSNQSHSSILSRMSDTSVAEPQDSPTSSPISPTMSVDSSAGFVRRINRDVVFVPINITYENTPELPSLIEEVISHQPNRQAPAATGPVQGVVRPSEAMDKRNRIPENPESNRKLGRVLVGVGKPVSVQDTAEELYQRNNDADEALVVETLLGEIQKSQRSALVVSPVSLVAAIVLYGRATGGVSFGKIKDMMEWLRAELSLRSVQMDWQDGEDIDAIVLYAFRMLDDTKNIIIDGKGINKDTSVRVNDHADNVMALSYYANQIIDVFLLDAFFAVVYLSFAEDKVSIDEFTDRFRFLVQILEREFVISGDVKEKPDIVFEVFESRKVIRRHNDSELFLCANMESDPVRYEQLVFLASLIYPTIDSYWITSCSLSALEAVPMIPLGIVPLLAQWIATHLITGRRTIYREVLSTESSRTATDVFKTLGFLTEVQAKERLSPDAQILLHELGIPTTETLICLSSGDSNDVSTPVEDPQDIMKAVMAQIQMNRANSNMADLCQQIDSYRLGTLSQRETFQNKLVFQKCLKQIKGILQGSTGFAKKRHIQLPDHEDGLVQLVYALRTSSAPSIDRLNQGRAQRRISEAYNLR